MRQQLDPETRAAMVDYRLERAHSTLREADLLFIKNNPPTAHFLICSGLFFQEVFHHIP